MIQQYLTTEQGEEEIRQLTPSNDEDTIQAWLDETEDGMKVQRLRGGLPIPKLNNIKPHMKVRRTMPCSFSSIRTPTTNTA